MTPSYAPVSPTSDAPDLSVFERLVKRYYLTKFQASSSKIDRFMAILVHDPPSYASEPPTSDPPDLSVFEPLVKNYYYEKFRASSSKIDRVMAILVHEPPPTPLNPPPLTLLTSLYLSA